MHIQHRPQAQVRMRTWSACLNTPQLLVFGTANNVSALMKQIELGTLLLPPRKGRRASRNAAAITGTWTGLTPS